MKHGFSIRYKFLAVITLLLVVCVGSYLFMASSVFRGDKEDFVFDLNKGIVSNLASDLETAFASATDKMRLAAYFYNSRDARNLAILAELLAASQEIVFVGGSEHFSQLNRRFFRNDQFNETYALPEDYFEEVISESKPVPFSKLQSEGEAIWNATIENGPMLIGYGKSVVIEGADGKPQAHFAVVAYLRADRIVKALSRGQFNQALITNAAGEILAHPNAQILRAAKDQTISPLLEAAKNPDVRTSVLKFQFGGEDYLGAFAKAANDRLIVISKVPTSVAFAAVDDFLRQSLLVAMMLVTLAFIAAILFSKSLTQPIQVLMSGMAKVAEGELTTQIHVGSRDEIAELARSFNGMIRELKTSREALEEINRELENKVRERTLQLEKQNQAVKSAQEALLRTTRLAAVGEIAGRAAHEVLNPLTTILARLERLQGRLGKERMQELELLKAMIDSWRDDFKTGGFGQLVKAWEAPSRVMNGASLWDEDLKNIDEVRGHLTNELKRFAEDAEFLHREAQRIGRIVQSMRSLSVVHANRRELNLVEKVEEACNIMRDLASQHGIPIEILSSSPKAQVLADSDELIQALTNLLRNSIQAAVEQRELDPGHQGHIGLRISDGGGAWNVRVSDNGTGIKTEDQAKLFEHQFSTKGHGEGTGLGLNISRRFIRAMGGDIVLENSEPAKGTTFLVTLPKIKSQSQQGAA
jgi:signal transduction histidine kinase